ncbi:hypothetical protein BEH_07685 [Priestia filamentosa]|uniref:Uncharacterized protein n=1 Tax=Priestia filamentosa TaxID=1402861 RepID=A0A0H4KGQ3_9BACI|nr:hypothetical protein [Priestia filamentosa]AKO91991.1 hypothetical protein BEH_07685 [Priestia filamentosa]
MKVLTKYPVVSQNGNQYRIDAWEDKWGTAHIEVFVYLGKSKIFKRDKFKSVYGGDEYGTAYDAPRWKYNYVAMAKDQVISYENYLKNIERKATERNDGVKEFSKWDGKC